MTSEISERAQRILEDHLGRAVTARECAEAQVLACRERLAAAEVVLGEARAEEAAARLLAVAEPADLSVRLGADVAAAPADVADRVRRLAEGSR